MGHSFLSRGWAEWLLTYLEEIVALAQIEQIVGGQLASIEVDILSVQHSYRLKKCTLLWKVSQLTSAGLLVGNSLEVAFSGM